MTFIAIFNWCKQPQECHEVPNEECKTKDVKVPKQEKEHKKKCLLSDDNSLPSTPTSAPAPTAYPTPAPSYPKEPTVETNILRSNSNITYIETFGNAQFLISSLNVDQV